MKIKDILTFVAVAMMTGGCSSSEEAQQEGRVPILLSASVGAEVTTRGVQETALASGETVYVWGKEGSGNYDYLQAWALTAGADGALSGSAKYYPLSGETLTMVALHGNFSYTEGTALPATISHSVEANQSTAGNYEKSDLLRATVSGSSADATGKNLAFTHMLSKIEIKLHPGEGYSDISSADVKLRGVLPTITINPADGTLGSASGSATLITPRNTVEFSNTTSYAVYEAIIPPQAAPADFLNIKIGDKIATVAADAATFASNKRYVYDITITEFKVSVTSSITSWGSGVNADVTSNKTVLIGRPKLPIEYVAEHNMQTLSTIASDDKIIHSAFFYWGTSTTSPTENIQKFINGTAKSGYHLPSKAEWCAVMAPAHAQTTSDTDLTMGGDTRSRITYRRGSSSNLSETVAWGVHNGNTSSTCSADNYLYDVNQVFYNDYNCPDDDDHQYIGYGLRFKNTDGNKYYNGIYTCAYRYEYKESDSDVGGPSLTVKVTYVGPNQNITIETVSDEGWWTSPDFTLVFPACGRSPGSGTDAGDHAAGWGDAEFTTNGYYWSATPRTDMSRVFNAMYGTNTVSGNSWHALSYGFTIRLFKDAD